MIRLLTFQLLIILCFQIRTNAQSEDKIFTIYLVRHSEKDSSSSNNLDPLLTECGRQRSNSLNRFFKEVPLKAIYTTNYNRTKNTALPILKSKGLEPIQYSPQDLIGLSKQLINLKQDALVVGHSNTTGVLAGILTGEEIGEFDIDIYDRIYHIVFYKSTSRLHLLHSAFECKEKANL
jgi:broad specificity phosphatase PhoE